MEGERSGLFYEATRIVDELRPTWAIWENVPGLLSSDNGRDFTRVLREMDRIGYNGAWRVLDSQYVGVAQRRRRVFGVFTCGDSGAAGCAEILSVTQGLQGYPPPSREKGQGVARGFETSSSGNRFTEIPYRMTAFGKYVDGDTASTLSARDYKSATDLVVVKTTNTKAHGSNVSTKGVSYTLDSAPNQAVLAFDMAHADDPARLTGDKVNCLQARMGTGGNQAPCVCLNDQGGDRMEVSHGITGTLQQQSKGHEPTITSNMRARKLTPVECSRLQGFPDNWTEGFADSVRYKMLGNAVTVNVVEWIAKRLMAHIKGGCKSALIELNPDYVEMIKKRVSQSFLEL